MYLSCEISSYTLFMVNRASERIISKIGIFLNIDAQYFVGGGMWLLLAQAFTVCSSLVSTILFAYYLTETDFGIYRYIIGLAAFFSAFALTGIGQSIAQLAAKGYTDYFRYSTKLTFIYGLASTSVSLIGAYYYHFQGNDILAIGCLFIALLQPISILFLNTLAYLYGLKNFKEGTYFQGIKSITVMATSICTLLITHNLIWLLFIYFFTQAFTAIVGYLYYRPKTYTPSTIPSPLKKQYLRFAQHTSIRNLIVGSAARLDSIIVFQQLGAASLAIFTIATLVPDQIKGVFKNILALLIPKYSQYDSLAELRRHIPKRCWQFGFILIVVTVIFIILVPYLYSLIFPKYINAIFYTQLLALSFPASIYLLPLSALQSQVQEDSLYYFNGGVSVIQLIVTFFLTIQFGLLGAIIARIIIQYTMMAGSFYYLFRKI